MGERIKTALQNFKLSLIPSGITRAHFLRSAWENLDIDQVSIPYVVHRTLFLLYFLIVPIHSISVSDAKNIYFIYATRWSLWMQGIWGMLYACRLYYRLYKERSKKLQPATDIDLEAVGPENVGQKTKMRQLHWIDSVIWVLFSIVQTTPYTVAIGYWGLIYNPEIDGYDIFKPLLTHGFNAILAFIDLFVTAIPMRIAHVLYAVSFITLYVTFTGIYELTGGLYEKPEKPYIYIFLDWKQNPGTAWKFSFLSIVWFAILYMGIWLLYRLRSTLVLICEKSLRKTAYTVPSDDDIID